MNAGAKKTRGRRDRRTGHVGMVQSSRVRAMKGIAREDYIQVEKSTNALGADLMEQRRMYRGRRWQTQSGRKR